MSAGDLAAVLVSIAAVVTVVLVMLCVVWLNRTLAAVRQAAEQLQATLPGVEELAKTVEAANTELDRVEHLLDSAETVTATVGTASRLALGAVSSPVIRGLSMAAGAGRVVGSLRHRGEPDQPTHHKGRG